jgi:hypothetical protein
MAVPAFDSGAGDRGPAGDQVEEQAGEGLGDGGGRVAEVKEDLAVGDVVAQQG